MSAWTAAPEKRLRTVMPLTIMFVLTACVGESVFVDLTYPPETEMVYARSATPETSAVGLRTRSLILLVTDEREKPEKIGAVLGGFFFPGESHSNVHTDDNLLLWVHDAVAHELKLLNYQILDGQIAGADGSVDQLKVAVTNLITACYMSCGTDVSLAASLNASGGEVVDAEFEGYGSKWSLNEVEPKIEESLRRALQESIRTMLVGFGFVPDGKFKDADASARLN